MSQQPAIYLYDPEHCPFTATWNVIGGKWKGVLWWRLSNGLGRFGELQRAMNALCVWGGRRLRRRADASGLRE